MSTVFLVPCVLAEDALQTIPSYILDTVKQCQVIFAENERTARRFLKALDKSIEIGDFEWFAIHKAEEEQLVNFREKITAGKNIAIISEAGCPGIADPGQILVAEAQRLGCTVKPLVGPSSILLALMAAGMNGQQFEFVGYLPIEAGDRVRRIKELEAASLKENSTKIFIETPYRNNQLVEALLQHCNGNTKLHISVDLTGKNEKAITKTISEWKKNKPELHKQTAVFMIYAGV